MAKIESIELPVYGEIPIYASSMIFVAFKKKYGKSLQKQLQDDPEDMEALAFVVLKAYESACVINKEEVKFDLDGLLYATSIEDLTDAVSKLYPTSEKTGEDQKKTVKKVK